MARRSPLFIKLDLDYGDHPKIVDLSDGAFRAHVEMIMYARKYLTDGRIPNRFAKRFGTDAVSELLTNHPERPSLTQDDAGDYWLHDFTAEQGTREAVEAKRLVNVENGKRGGRPAKRKVTQPVTQSVTEPVTQPVTETEPEEEEEEETELLRSSGGAGGGLSEQLPVPLGADSATEVAPTEKPKAKRGTRIPDGWRPSRIDANITAETGLDRSRLNLELDKFRDYWTAKTGAQATKLDWDATWRNWIRNAKDRAPRQPKGRASDMTGDDWDQIMAAAAAKEAEAS